MPPGGFLRWARQTKVLRKKPYLEVFPLSRLRFIEGDRAGWADFTADPVPASFPAAPYL